MPPVAPAPSQPPRVVEGTSANTVWIWLVVLLPLLTVVPMVGYISQLQQGIGTFIAAIPTGGSTPDPQVLLNAELGILLNGWYLALVLLGWAIWGLGVWFAALDSRELARRGFVRPFHWAWTFLSAWVYVIGRSVVVRRRGGRGAVPLVVFIATQGAMILATTIWTLVVVLQVMTEAMSTVPFS